MVTEGKDYTAPCNIIRRQWVSGLQSAIKINNDRKAGFSITISIIEEDCPQQFRCYLNLMT